MCKWWFLLVLVVWFSTVEAVEKVRWCVADFPPYFITRGPDKGQGTNDKITSYIQSALPAYQHQFIKANIARIIEEMKSGDPIVCGALYKTAERQRFLLFSALPSFLVLPNNMVILGSERYRFEPYLLKDGSINLEGVLSSGKFKVGTASKRVYSGVIDSTLKQHKLKYINIVQASGNIFGGLLNMLQRKNIDLTFGFPIETTYAAKKYKLTGMFELIPVAGMEPWSEVYISAPKTEWGRRILSDIEKVFSNKKAIMEFSSYYEAWLDEATQLRYRQLVDAYYSDKF